MPLSQRVCDLNLSIDSSNTCSLLLGYKHNIISYDVLDHQVSSDFHINNPMEPCYDNFSLPCFHSVKSNHSSFSSPSNFNNNRLYNHVYTTEICQHASTSKGIPSKLIL